MYTIHFIILYLIDGPENKTVVSDEQWNLEQASEKTIDCDLESNGNTVYVWYQGVESTVTISGEKTLKLTKQDFSHVRCQNCLLY